jgi:acyl dehydratase
VRSFLFPVDASLVLQFARAIGDRSPVLDDPEFTAAALRGDVVPPPTFLVAADHFDPECPRRPEVGEAFPGSGRVSQGWVRPEPPPTGSARARGLHAEEVFEYVRHPRVGEVLTAEVTTGAQWDKVGRSGTLHFHETVTTFTDATGELVAATRWRSVSTSATSGDRPAGNRATASPSASVSAVKAGAIEDQVPPRALPERPLKAGEVSVGERWSQVVIDDLTIGQLVRYAGASGDFIALHHDVQIAQIVALHGPGVFAHGMLTMGASSTVLSRLVGTERLRRLSGRMVAIVRPGDSLATVATVAAVTPAADGSSVVSLRLQTRKQDGTVVLEGDAEAVLDDHRAAKETKT